MFGIYRSVLALFVVWLHVYGTKALGSFAVYAFFSLSGFLMTLLMCERYKGRPLAFAKNRFLRLFPGYWVVCVATALVIFFVPVPQMLGGNQLHSWGAPHTTVEWIKNALFVVIRGDIRLVPPAWAVTNELIFYVLIGLGVTATARRALVSLAVAALMAWLWIDSGEFYFSPFAAALPFALGGTIYHVVATPWGKGFVRSPLFLVLGSSLMLYFGYVAALHQFCCMRLIYLHMVASVPIIVGLYLLGPTAPKEVRLIDEFIGRFSYPLYLTHFLAMLVVVPQYPFRSDEAWFRPTVVAVTFLLSAIIVFCVDIPVDRVRRRIRDNSAANLLPVHPGRAETPKAAMF